MSELNTNKHIRYVESQESYVILVKRGKIIKGVARGLWTKNHIDCTIKPQKMLKFKSKEKALDFWHKNSQKDSELELHKIAKLETTFNLLS